MEREKIPFERSKKFVFSQEKDEVTSNFQTSQPTNLSSEQPYDSTTLMSEGCARSLVRSKGSRDPSNILWKHERPPGREENVDTLTRM